MPDSVRSLMPLPVKTRCSGRILEGLYSVPEIPSAWIIALGCENQPRIRLEHLHQTLNDDGYACLSFQVLETREIWDSEASEFYRTNADEIAERIFATTERFGHLPELIGMKAGMLVWGLAAGAALVAAARMPDTIHTAVVCEGRPDFAGRCLKRIEIPVIFLTTAHDQPLCRANSEAAASMKKSRALQIKGGSQLDPGNCQEMLDEAEDWFHKHLSLTS